MAILTLKPIDLSAPPAGLVPYERTRGMVIYWRPTSAPSTRRQRRQQLQLPLPDWQARHITFKEVSPSGADEPPHDAEEQARFVRLAYALIAANHPIPSDAEIYYQVWW